MKSPSIQYLKKATQDLEFWMTNLPQKLRSLPITNLAIPGSHDSFTSQISKDSDIAPDAEPILQNLEFLGPVVKYFMANWSRTQELMVEEQLRNGIRYFDLRIASKKNTENLYFVHSLYSEEVVTGLNEIERFLETHPGEVVILDCQHFYAMTQDDHQRLMQHINQIFGTKLMPYTEHMQLLTLEYMTTQFRYQVIVIYRSDEARYGQPLLWPSASFPTPWPDTVSQTELFEYLDDGLKKRDPAIGYISQCVLTPTFWFIFEHLCSTLKKTCAVDLEEAKNNWIKKQTPGGQGLNIIIADFIELNDNQYVKDVIELNSVVLDNFNKSSHVVTIMPPIDLKD